MADHGFGFVRPDDVKSTTIQEALAFFNRYDQYDSGKEEARRRIAEDMNLDPSNGGRVWRWIRVVRPRFQKTGEDWPFYDDPEGAAGRLQSELGFTVTADHVNGGPVGEPEDRDRFPKSVEDRTFDTGEFYSALYEIEPSLQGQVAAKQANDVVEALLDIVAPALAESHAEKVAEGGQGVSPDSALEAAEGFVQATADSSDDPSVSQETAPEASRDDSEDSSDEDGSSEGPLFEGVQYEGASDLNREAFAEKLEAFDLDFAQIARFGDAPLETLYDRALPHVHHPPIALGPEKFLESLREVYDSSDDSRGSRPSWNLTVEGTAQVAQSGEDTTETAPTSDRIAEHFPVEDEDAGELVNYPHHLSVETAQELANRYSVDGATQASVEKEFNLSHDEFIDFRAAHGLRHNQPTSVDPNKSVDEAAQELTQRQKQQATERKAKQKYKREQKKAAENYWNIEQVLQDAAEEMESRDYTPPQLNVQVSSQTDLEPSCLAVNAQDYHLGCRPAGTGLSPEDYAETLLEANASVFEQAIRAGNVQTAYFVVGADLLNVDNKQGHTTRGTPQDNQMNTGELLVHAEDFVRDMVNLLLQFVPEVELVFVRGNHDEILGQAVYQMAAAHFADEERVTAPREFNQRQYRTWQDLFLCFTHGDYKKKIVRRLPQICINEARSIIGGTRHSTIHTGHYHSENVRFDKAGWVHQQAPAPVQSDEYEEGEGYTGTRRGVQATVHFQGGADHVINETLEQEDLTA